MPCGEPHFGHGTPSVLVADSSWSLCAAHVHAIATFENPTRRCIEKETVVAHPCAKDDRAKTCVDAALVEGLPTLASC